MIFLTLMTHAIVGAAIVGLVPAHPLLGLSLAFASHFILDALPHWDYPIVIRGQIWKPFDSEDTWTV